jgi:hypothetical protein
MRALIFIIWGAGAGILGYVYPFAAVLRGGRFFRTIGISWALLVGLILLGFVLPPHGSRSEWPRDEAATVGAVCLVWIFPLMSALIALFVRWLLRRCWPRALAWVESVGKHETKT